ncbi:MAG: sigma-70 family RNA polymerase sigma factor [Clostridiales bacterium]|nr:sigma-70 family RNA polymerase sigma factor [Clostridiales bacterium]
MQDAIRIEQLAEEARLGDAHAQEELFRAYKDTVRRKAQLFFLAGGDPEDLIQEGMIGLFQALRSYDPEKNTSFRTFADLCITRQIQTAVKSAARQKHLPLNTSLSLHRPLESGAEGLRETTLEETLPSGAQSDPETRLLLKEALESLWDKEGVFSDMERSVWSLYLQGQSYSQIAAALGKSPKTVDNALQRTKRKLSKYL